MCRLRKFKPILVVYRAYYKFSKTSLLKKSKLHQEKIGKNEKPFTQNLLYPRLGDIYQAISRL